MCPKRTLESKVATTTALCFNTPCESWLSCINTLPVSCPRHTVGFILIFKVHWVLLASIKWSNGELPRTVGAGVATLSQPPDFKVSESKFVLHISFSMTTSCLQYVLRSIGFVVLFVFALMLCQPFPIQLVAEASFCSENLRQRRTTIAA